MALRDFTMGSVAVWACALVTAVGGGFVLYTLLKVDRQDLAGYHGQQIITQAIDARAGDLVSVSPDTLSARAICRFAEIDGDLAEPQRVAARYRNALVEYIPDVPPFEDPELDANEIRFRGMLRRLEAGSRPARFITDDCECEMAKAVLQRRTVCVAESDLEEEGGGSLRAISFRSGSVYIPREVFAACGLPVQEWVEEQGVQDCSRHRNLHWTSRLRLGLGLIEEHPEIEADRRAALDGR